MRKRAVAIPTIVLVIGALILYVGLTVLGGLGLVMVIFGVPMVIAGTILMLLAVASKPEKMTNPTSRRVTSLDKKEDSNNP